MITDELFKLINQIYHADLTKTRYICWGVELQREFGLILWHINYCWLFNAKSILYVWTVLFQTIQFNISKQFDCKKQFYFKQFPLVNKVKWFQVLLCITNNPNKHYSLIYTQLNVKKVPFQIIPFSINTHFKCLKQFYFKQFSLS